MSVSVKLFSTYLL